MERILYEATGRSDWLRFQKLNPPVTSIALIMAPLLDDGLDTRLVSTSCQPVLSGQPPTPLGFSQRRQVVWGFGFQLSGARVSETLLACLPQPPAWLCRHCGLPRSVLNRVGAKARTSVGSGKGKQRL